MLKFTFTDDFRTFKKGEVIDLSDPLESVGIVGIVGDNGVGKSSFLQAFRGQHVTNDQSMYSRDFKEIAEKVSVEHDYQKILFFDAVKDDPLDMNNAFDAYSYVTNGGMGAERRSHGEGTLGRLASFLLKVTAAPGKEKTLIVIDEADKGFSLRLQGAYRQLLSKFQSIPCDIVVVTHNPFLIASLNSVYDVETRSFVTSTGYIHKKTGFIILNDELLEAFEKRSKS
jgi:predicted ATPase